MAKLKKQIKRLRKQIRNHEEVVEIVKKKREKYFERLSAMRGKLYYRENPLYPQSPVETTTGNGNISMENIRKSFSALVDRAESNLKKAEEHLRLLDMKIQNKLTILASEKETLAELEELAES